MPHMVRCCVGDTNPGCLETVRETVQSFREEVGGLFVTSYTLFDSRALPLSRHCVKVSM